jgi:hypothetical protein
MNVLFQEDEDEESDWVHFSDYDSSALGQVVIGLEISGDNFAPGENEYNCQTPLSVSEDLVSEVRQELLSRFGYQGTISTIAVVNYSY